MGNHPTICRGGGGDDAGRGPLSPPAFPDGLLLSGRIAHQHRATIKALPTHPNHPRPYGIPGWHLWLMPIGRRQMSPVHISTPPRDFISSIAYNKEKLPVFSLSRRRKPVSTSFLLGLLLIAIGLLPGSIGAFAFLRRLRFLRTAHTTSGVVNEVILKHLVDGHSYQPKITFTTQTGETVSLPSVRMSNPPRFRVGQEVPVVYDPSNPYRAYIRSFSYLWFVSLLFGGIGSLLFILGMILMIFNKN